MTESKSPVADVAVAAEVDSSEEDGRKIFVGNLAFEVDDAELAGFFSAIGKVASANVICRGTRSMGYGFVTFEEEKHAQSAYDQLNKKEFNGREINVEMAKARAANAEKTRRGGFRGGFRGGRGRPRFEGAYNYGAGYRYGQFDDAYGMPGAAAAGYGGFPRGGARGGFRRGRGRNPKSAERKTGEPSKTTLFIANLPYSMTNESLAKLFEAYRVAKAHVITLRNGKSKGYGFVEFETEAEQQKALLEMNNAVVEERPLAVKIALNLPEEAQAEASQE